MPSGIEPVSGNHIGDAINVWKHSKLHMEFMEGNHMTKLSVQCTIKHKIVGSNPSINCVCRTFRLINLFHQRITDLRPHVWDVTRAKNKPNITHLLQKEKGIVANLCLFICINFHRYHRTFDQRHSNTTWLTDDQAWAAYLSYLDTLHLDIVFGVTDMYLDAFVNISNVTKLSRYIAKVSEFQIRFRCMIILNTLICNCIF